MSVANFLPKVSWLHENSLHKHIAEHGLYHCCRNHMPLEAFLPTYMLQKSIPIDMSLLRRTQHLKSLVGTMLRRLLVRGMCLNGLSISVRLYCTAGLKPSNVSPILPHVSFQIYLQDEEASVYSTLRGLSICAKRFPHGRGKFPHGTSHMFVNFNIYIYNKHHYIMTSIAEHD